MPQTVLIAGLSSADRDAISNRGPRWRPAQNYRAVSADKVDWRDSVVIADPGCLDESFWVELQRTRALGRTPSRIIYRFSLTKRCCVNFLKATLILENCQVSIVGIDNLSDDIAAIDDYRLAESPTTLILSSMRRAIPEAVAEIAVAAIVVGRTRTNVRELAATCGIPVRTIESRLRSARFMKAAELLAVSLCLHAVWALDVARVPIKRVAKEVGFNSSTSFANFIKRHTGVSPSHLRDFVGFAALSRQVADAVGSARTPAPTCVSEYPCGVQVWSRRISVAD